MVMLVFSVVMYLFGFRGSICFVMYLIVGVSVFLLMRIVLLLLGVFFVRVRILGGRSGLLNLNGLYEGVEIIGRVVLFLMVMMLDLNFYSVYFRFIE